MRVGLDLAVTRLARTGITRAAEGLRAALERREDVRVHAIGAGPVAADGTVRRRLTALALDLVWHPWLGRRRAGAAGVDVYHAPHIRAPLWSGGPPTVVTVADLNFLVRPETVSAWNRRYSRATVRRVLASADRIIAMSAATADDLDALLGVDGRLVRVVHPGIDAHGAHAGPGEQMDAPVDGPFVLFVGTPEPRKNLPRLVAAMEKLRSAGRAERLVVVGSGGWGGVRVEASDAVVPLGRVSDAVLRALYANARCLALPSLHEGFGYPALEAMVAGCPVVAARAGALPEVCGDAAVLVDPLSVTSIADGLVAAIEDSDRLRAAGRVRAGGFDWTVSAERTVSVYRELV